MHVHSRDVRELGRVKKTQAQASSCYEAQGCRNLRALGIRSASKLCWTLNGPSFLVAASLEHRQWIERDPGNSGCEIIPPRFRIVSTRATYGALSALAGTKTKG